MYHIATELLWWASGLTPNLTTPQEKRQIKKKIKRKFSNRILPVIMSRSGFVKLQQSVLKKIFKLFSIISNNNLHVFKLR
jgi:hypothetical protein